MQPKTPLITPEELANATEGEIIETPEPSIKRPGQSPLTDQQIMNLVSSGMFKAGWGKTVDKKHPRKHVPSAQHRKTKRKLQKQARKASRQIAKKG